MGYSPSRFSYRTIFSATCIKTAWILAISTFSPFSTSSSISAVWVQFQAETDTKDTKDCFVAYTIAVALDRETQR